MTDLLQAIARLPQVHGGLSIRPVAGTPNGLCLLRTDTGAEALVAVVMGAEAPGYARLLSSAPVLLDLLATVLVRWDEAVANDEEINGGDAVEWLSAFTTDARQALEQLVGPEAPEAPARHR